MENLLRLEYRKDLDRAEPLSRDLYRKASLDTGLHTRRIRAALEEVEASDGSGVHLEFCLAGTRSNSYLCAVWPKDAVLASVCLRDEDEIARRTKCSGHVTVQADYSPAFVRFDLFGRTCPFRQYVFFAENPHQPHRPFFGTWYDAVLDQRGRDDALVISYHLPRIKAEYERKFREVADAFATHDMETLIKLQRFVHRLEL